MFYVACMIASSKYDVALSFAGEERAYVDQVANHLRDHGVKVFYDIFEVTHLWGKNLYEHLTDLYQNQAKYTVMFISKAYGEKLWTNHERRAAQARAFEDCQEYILPARFDNTEIPGVLPTTHYISLSDQKPEDFAKLIIKKLVSSGGTVPTEIVRKNLSFASLAPGHTSTKFIAKIVDQDELPIEGVNVMLQGDNGTTLNSQTNNEGHCSIDVKTRRTFSVLIAHQNYPALIIENIDPSNSLYATLPKTKHVGSVLINGTGHIPGLNGRLNPILDTSNRTYLYADNIAINGGKAQPTTFSINETMELEDAQGNITLATVKYISAGVSLLQFNSSNIT